MKVLSSILAFFALVQCIDAADGFGATLKRVKDALQGKERSREDLKIGIAGFYDRSSKLWESVWGEHMHHGYYIPEDRTDHIQAQIDLIDEVLKWGDVKSAKSVVDVGCGIGGSSRHIARKYNCKAQGITLSPYQANRGNELAKEQGLSDQASFQVRFSRFTGMYPDDVKCNFEFTSAVKWIRYIIRWQMHWICLLTITALILFGVWRVVSTCQTKRNLFQSCSELLPPVAAFWL